MGAGSTAQCLRTHTMLTEDLRAIPCIHTLSVTAPCNFSSRGSAVFFGPAADNCSVAQTQTYTLDLKRHNFLKCLFCITFLLTCFSLNLFNKLSILLQRRQILSMLNYCLVGNNLLWHYSISCDLNHLIYLCEPYLMFLISICISICISSFLKKITEFYKHQFCEIQTSEAGGSRLAYIA